jgi:hypothetical protein
MIGAQGHNAAPPMFRAGPHGAGMANTNKVEVRSMFLMDPTNAPAYVSYMDTGVYSLLGFYNEFIKPMPPVELLPKKPTSPPY